MKTPTSLNELNASLHLLVEAGAFMHFGEQDEVHNLVDELISTLEQVQENKHTLSKLEAAVVQSFVLTLESFIEHDEPDQL